MNHASSRCHKRSDIEHYKPQKQDSNIDIDSSLYPYLSCVACQEITGVGATACLPLSNKLKRAGESSSWRQHPKQAKAASREKSMPSNEERRQGCAGN